MSKKQKKKHTKHIHTQGEHAKTKQKNKPKKTQDRTHQKQITH